MFTFISDNPTTDVTTKIKANRHHGLKFSPLSLPLHDPSCVPSAFLRSALSIAPRPLQEPALLSPKLLLPDLRRCAHIPTTVNLHLILLSPPTPSCNLLFWFLPPSTATHYTLPPLFFSLPVIKFLAPPYTEVALLKVISEILMADSNPLFSSFNF